MFTTETQRHREKLNKKVLENTEAGEDTEKSLRSRLVSCAFFMQLNYIGQDGGLAGW